jgi:hypothetical protein
MRASFVQLGGMGSVLLGLALTAPVAAQNDGRVHRMVITNGDVQTVHYFALGDVSPSEQTALHEMARAENEVALSDQLMALRRQYVHDERFMQNHRQAIQTLFYGAQSDQFFGGFGGPVLAGYPGSYFFGNGYAYPLFTSLGGYSGGLVQSLAYGMGDEGSLKAEIARTLAKQATPEYAAQASRQYDAALARAYDASPRVRAAVGFSDKGGIKPAVAVQANGAGDVWMQPRGASVVVTLKNGNDKVEGTVARQDSDWIVVETTSGDETIARNAVSRISTKKR